MTYTPRKRFSSLNREQQFRMTPIVDREMLEMVLYRAVPRREANRLAKELMACFGSFAEAISAPPLRLMEVDGMPSGVIAEFELIEAAVQRFTKEAMRKRLPLGMYSEVIDYCRVAGAFQDTEIFRVLFLDKKFGLIADEVLGFGTVDHVPVYPREVVRRAIELAACRILLVHNHPSGDPIPSTVDVDMTLAIMAACDPLGITVQDHIIVGREGHSSLRGMGLLS